MQMQAGRQAGGRVGESELGSNARRFANDFLGDCSFLSSCIGEGLIEVLRVRMGSGLRVKHYSYKI